MEKNFFVLFLFYKYLWKNLSIHKLNLSCLYKITSFLRTIPWFVINLVYCSFWSCHTNLHYPFKLRKGRYRSISKSYGCKMYYFMSSWMKWLFVIWKLGRTLKYIKCLPAFIYNSYIQFFLFFTILLILFWR